MLITVGEDNDVVFTDVSHGSLVPDSMNDPWTSKDPIGIKKPVVLESDVVDTSDHGVLVQAVKPRMGFHLIEVSTCPKCTVVCQELGINCVVSHKAFATVDVVTIDHDASTAFDVFDRLTVDEELFHDLTTMT